ncbi:hypothetical protein ASG56_05890 [Rhodococcus sp. Leaf7]|nr:hypothetical protein ASG56_05890 [Rhodococcus sp. Leaf7]KQU42600.1 hypothetical protein ASG64_05890 [Rhodococcus sp. Leaf247]
MAMSGPAVDDLDDLRRGRLLARSALHRAQRLPFKPVSSAKWVDVSSSNGMVRVQIEHDTIRGVTPEMMRWWFEHLADSTTWNGVDFSGPAVSHYHLWHHRDHIAVTPLDRGAPVDCDESDLGASTVSTGFAVGARTRIDERFNDYRDRISATVVTTDLDDAEFTFEIRMLGRTVGHVLHRYSPERGGLRFYAETVIGLPTRAGRLANLVRPLMYSARTADHWIRHNIEETGRSEDVIPVLHAHHTGTGALSA